jgi:ABC-type nitrate/sulfonate/bicarbonate transport system permease component
MLPLALVAIWQAWGHGAGVARYRFRRACSRPAVELIASGDLPLAIAQSVMRVFGGFAVAAALAVPLGLAMGTSGRVERAVDPLVESFRPIAAIAILPLAILWLGTGTRRAIAIVAYAAFFPIVVNTVAGAQRVPPTLLRAAATMGLSRAATLRTGRHPVRAAVDRDGPAHRHGRRVDGDRRRGARGRREGRRRRLRAASAR